MKMLRTTREIRDETTKKRSIERKRKKSIDEISRDSHVLGTLYFLIKNYNALVVWLCHSNKTLLKRKLKLKLA